MDKDKHIPSATYNFHGNVGPLIHHVDTLNMVIDKDMNVKIQNLEELQSQSATPPVTEKSEVDPSSLIFKPNEQNRAAVENLLKEVLSSSHKKSVVCRKLYEQRALYNLHAQDDTSKAKIINVWLTKFAIMSNFKTTFTRKDFGEYYNSNM